MNEHDLEQEVQRIYRLFYDASEEYADRLRAAGYNDLAHEWHYNLGDLLGDFRDVGQLLAKVYTAPQENIPEAMKNFFQDALGFALHSRGHMSRLEDILEGRPPSYPPESA